MMCRAFDVVQVRAPPRACTAENKTKMSLFGSIMRQGVATVKGLLPSTSEVKGNTARNVSAHPLQLPGPGRALPVPLSPAPRVLEDDAVPPGIDAGALENTGVVLSVALMKEHGSLGVFAPLTAGTYPGSGRLHIIAHASTDWCDMARVASVCARRLRSKLGLRDMWASDVDLYLGSAYMFLQLSMGSSGAAVALAIIAEATDEPHRHEWAVTGSVTLAGDVMAVLGVREKAVAALREGCKGLVLPRASLAQLSDTAWPEEPVVSQEIRDLWPQARAQLLFKPVSTVTELVAFCFPGLAAKARAGSAMGSRRRGRKRQAVREDVGPVSRIAVPLWVGGDKDLRPQLAVVEACLVKGLPKPEVTGGFPGSAELDLRLALQLLRSHVAPMTALAQAKGRTALACDPAQPDEYQPHLNIYPQCIGPGMYALAMFISLACVTMGLQVRLGTGVVGFCAVNGSVLSLGPTAVKDAVASAAAKGISVLYVPELDLPMAQQEANKTGGMRVRGVATVEDFLVDEDDDAGLWVTEA